MKIDINFPAEAESVLVRRIGDSFVEAPVARGMSVLNLQSDLISHLNEYPFTDEWLASLRNFIDAKLEARRQAALNSGVAIPLETGDGFRIIHDVRGLKSMEAV